MFIIRMRDECSNPSITVIFVVALVDGFGVLDVHLL